MDKHIFKQVFLPKDLARMIVIYAEPTFFDYIDQYNLCELRSRHIWYSYDWNHEHMSCGEFRDFELYLHMHGADKTKKAFLVNNSDVLNFDNEAQLTTATTPTTPKNSSIYMRQNHKLYYDLVRHEKQKDTNENDDEFISFSFDQLQVNDIDNNENDVNFSKIHHMFPLFEMPELFLRTFGTRKFVYGHQKNYRIIYNIDPYEGYCLLDDIESDLDFFLPMKKSEIFEWILFLQTRQEEDSNYWFINLNPKSPYYSFVLLHRPNENIEDFSIVALETFITHFQLYMHPSHIYERFDVKMPALIKTRIKPKQTICFSYYNIRNEEIGTKYYESPYAHDYKAVPFQHARDALLGLIPIDASTVVNVDVYVDLKFAPDLHDSLQRYKKDLVWFVVEKIKD